MRMVVGRGVGSEHLVGKNATFADPSVLADLIVWSERVLTE